LKGHVITFAQEPTSLATILPLPAYRLCDFLKVVFVGQEQPSREQLKKVLRVRKGKIATALEWLMNHNILYKNIKLDRATLESLPKDEIPTALLATTVIVNIDPIKAEHYTGYTVDPIDEKNTIDDTDSEESDDERNMFDIFNHGSSVELRNSESTNNGRESPDTILMPHLNVPKNEYTDSTLLPAAFPTLFPYGVGGHEDTFRKQHIQFKQYIEH
ncbi:hypothetical protein C2G38_1915837, partial [Gigaspora rosea]